MKASQRAAMGHDDHGGRRSTLAKGVGSRDWGIVGDCFASTQERASVDAARSLVCSDRGYGGLFWFCPCFVELQACRALGDAQSSLSSLWCQSESLWPWCVREGVYSSWQYFFEQEVDLPRLGLLLRSLVSMSCRSSSTSRFVWLGSRASWRSELQTPATRAASRTISGRDLALTCPRRSAVG